MDPNHQHERRFIQGSEGGGGAIPASLPDLPEAVRRLLDSAWTPDPEAVAAYQRDGFVRLRGFLPVGTVAAMLPVVRAAVQRHGREARPLHERDAYGQAFLQVMNLGVVETAIAAITHSRRFATCAATLMGVGGVRLWHDQALHKEAGGAATPMHTDWHYIPTEAPLCGAWIPLHDVPLQRGALCYAPGTQRLAELRRFPVSPASDAALRSLLAERGIVPSQEPFAAGDVGFHDLRTVHWTAANSSGADRTIFNIFYLAEHARHAEEPFGEHQRRYWPCPGQTPGAPFGGARHPLLVTGLGG